MEKYLPSEETLKRYPVLTTNIGFDTHKLLLFLTYVYHPKSELIGISNIVERKFKAATLCEFDKDKEGRFKHEDSILGYDNALNLITLEYTKLFRNETFSEYVMQLNALFKELVRYGSGEVENEQQEYKNKKGSVVTKSALELKQEADTREKIAKNIKTIRQRITELKAELMCEDNSRYVLADLYEDANFDKITQVVTCEFVAERWKDGKAPLGKFNCYEL